MDEPDLIRKKKIPEFKKIIFTSRKYIIDDITRIMYATKSAPPPAMSAAGVSSQSSHVNAQGNYSIIVLQSHEYI